MDFTLKTYRTLLQTLKDAGYRFITFEEYMRKTEDGRRKMEVDDRSPLSGLRPPFVILRHDVDLLPENSLTFARIQHKMGIKGSYYFRAVTESWDEDIIKEIHNLGHEVGYHYEDLDKAGKRETTETLRRRDHFQEEKRNEKMKSDQSRSSETSGLRSPSSGLPDSNTDFAIRSFEKNLEKLRRLVPVSTICMHGSPRSKFDNRDLWKKYDYRDYGIIGEPYFDVNFDEIFYLTDTGRRWDGWRVSIRDKMQQQQEWIKQELVFRSTQEIIDRVKSEKLEVGNQDFPASGESGNVRTKFPHQLMMTFHPQRWTDNPLPWFRELIMQNAKNSVKYLINLRKENQ